MAAEAKTIFLRGARFSPRRLLRPPLYPFAVCPSSLDDRNRNIASLLAYAYRGQSSRMDTNAPAVTTTRETDMSVQIQFADAAWADISQDKFRRERGGAKIYLPSNLALQLQVMGSPAEFIGGIQVRVDGAAARQVVLGHVGEDFIELGVAL